MSLPCPVRRRKVSACVWMKAHYFERVGNHSMIRAEFEVRIGEDVKKTGLLVYFED